MALLDWLIIGSIALVAGTILGLRQQRRTYSNRFDVQARKRDSPDGCNEPELAGAPQHGCAQQYAEKEAISDSARFAADAVAIRIGSYPVEEAIRNGLTGVKTRRHFLEALEGECRRSTRAGGQFSLLMMDLDRLRQVNDRMGRGEGDKVLTAVAALLDARSKQPNVVARNEGDEFAILMPETNTQQAEILAEELRAAVEADDFLRAHEVTASFGIATFPDHGRTPQEILTAVGSGMYLAKHCSGNCVKVASLSLKPEDAERDKRLLEAYLEAAAEGMSSTAPDTFSHDQREFEPMKPLLDTITALAFAVEAKGPYMRDHSQAVSRLAAQIALQAGLSQAEIEEIRLAGLLHDIGKIDVPEYVLKKPRLLTAEEFEIMKSHPAWGAKMLEPLNVKAIERIVGHHHERYDGKGYPDGLAGEGVPLGARIVAVAECFHNMVSDLRYKNSRTFEDALAELRRCSGTQFDPEVVTAFLDWVRIHSDPRAQQ
jgi:diguanylate cyclase (GGDEF)-like protein/putative nucleotidyltransferase with HDIG domain